MKGMVIGLVGGDEARRMLAAMPHRRVGFGEPLDWSPSGALILDHALAARDGFERARAAIEIENLRRAGCTIYLASEEEDLLARLADEVWWIADGKPAARGDPRQVLDRYRRRCAERLRAWGAGAGAALAPSLRRGDGRAELTSLETLGAGGQPTLVWTSGEQCAVRVTVRFREAVEDPVVGIMIRTRVGFEVYGTNTELEKLKLGPCPPGQVLAVHFAFTCRLCPGEYTLTAASHDPDGVWHDWMEDALAVAVADTRYTAGVANLRAQVTLHRVHPL